MRSRTLFLVLVLPLAAPCLRAQSGRLDQTEVLGRLSVNYSPSYIAHLVKVRGLSFSPTQDFIYRVKLAGGDGILVERLSSSDAAPSVLSSADQDVPVRHLAKCAELIHTGAVEAAEPECRAAISENPKSPWPLLATAKVLEPDAFFRAAEMTSNGPKSARTEFLEQAAALAPNLAIVHHELASLIGSPHAVAETQKTSALDPDNLETTQAGDWSRTWELFGVGRAFNDREPDDEETPTASDGSIDVPSNVERIMKIEPDLASNHIISAGLYIQVSNFDKAREELNEAVRLEPGNAMPHFLIARMDFTLRDQESGLTELRESVRIAPAGAEQHVAVAAALEQLGRTAEALDELRATIAMHPTAYGPSNALVELSLAHKDRKAAIVELRRFLDGTSSRFADQNKFVEVHGSNIYHLLDLLTEDHQLEAAAQQYLYLLRYQPNNAELRNNYGNVLFDMRRIDEALAQYSEAARLNPHMADAHHNIGLCLAAKKNLDGAIQEFREALDLDPYEAHTQVFLGAALGQKGDLAGAEEQFQQVIAKNPKDADAHMGVAYALEQMKDNGAAIKELKATLELKPDSAEAENDLAWIYATADDLKLRDPAEALVLARRAVSTSAEPNAAFLDTLAEALLINGQSSEALKYELQAFQLDPENPEFKTRLPRFQTAANSHTVAKR
jgi:tetratricopeptide (TPR) repeat protein